MSHPSDDQLIPLHSTVAIIRGKNFGRTAIITGYTFLKDGKNFLNYLAEIDQREGTFALYHEDVEIIDPPTQQPAREQ